MPSRGRCWAGGGYGLGAYPGLGDGDGGPGAVGAERVSGRREPHPQGAIEWSAEAFGRRARRARRDRSSAEPQGSRRRRDHSPTGHYPGMVSQACRPQFDGSKARRGPGRPKIKREVGSDHSHGGREPGTGALTGLRGRWPIWDKRFPIKRLAMSCGATVCRRRRSASARLRGQPSSDPPGAGQIAVWPILGGLHHL